METKRKFIISIIVIIFMTAISILYSFGVFDSHAYTAKEGVLTLEKWHSEKDGVITLDGEWEFYPNELIYPHQNAFKDYQSIKKIIPVPFEWDRYIAETPTPYGVGTYRLIIKLPKDRHYSVKIDTVRNANKVFLNGQEAGAAGVPSKNLKEYRYDFTNYVATGKSNAKSMEIVLHVANYEYVRGGIVQSITFGEVEQISAKEGLSRFIEALLIAGYLFFGIFYANLHFQSKSHLYELFFSLFCLAEGLYVSTVNERWLFILFPTITPDQQVNIQMASMTLVFLFFILFIYLFFEIAVSKKIFALLCVILISETFVFLINIFFSNHFLTLVLPTKQKIVALTALFCYAYIFRILIKAFFKRNDESLFILTIVITFLLHGLLLILEFIYEITISGSILFLYLIMVFSLSLLMRYRLQTALQRAEKLSADLLLYDRLKDDFLVKTSHELGTPLNGIINLSKTLMEGIEGPLRKGQQESALLIHTIGKRLARIVEDLSYISNIKEDQTRLNAEPISIHVIEEVLAETAYLIPPSQNVQLINQVPKNLPLIFVDKQKLKQVVFNLLYNAIKNTTEGSITVSASVIQNEMQISVSDTGSGIEKEHVDMIFTSFYQVHNTTNNVEGLGLGLSITKKIIEHSGGRIWLTSEVGKGSCFSFTIPLAKEEQLLAQLQQKANKSENTLITSIDSTETFTELLSTKSTGAKPFTILVVDDAPANLKVLINMIRSLDYSVIAVDNGMEALRIINEETIDLIILDLMMPEMSGFEVCQLVRKKYDLVELPIIMLTASGQLSDLTYSLQIGANDFMQKPVNLEQLKARVDSLLKMKASAQEMIKQELGFYYAQIRPHFLYNTLNTVIALSYNDEKKTRDALEHLAVYFRAKLNFQQHHSVVPLEDELELLEAYISIEQLRFNNRLNVIYQVDHSIDINLPFMTLQPLAENAIQHGLMSREQGGTLWITIERQTPYIQIVIEDNGIGIPLLKQKELTNDKNKRIGFINPLKKISLIKGATFELDSKEGMGTKITILLPLP